LSDRAVYSDGDGIGFVTKKYQRIKKIVPNPKETENEYGSHGGFHQWEDDFEKYSERPSSIKICGFIQFLGYGFHISDKHKAAERYIPADVS
jgi:hypothetical protein